MTPLAHRASAWWAGITPGAIEAVKWTALLLMVNGHANAILFDRQWAWPNEVGRAAFLAFAFAFGYALARVPAERRARVYPRVLARLLGVGLLSLPLTTTGFGHDAWLPINIMFTFAAGFAILWSLQCGGPYGIVVAALVFLLSGAMVEFMWPGVALVVAMYACFARPGMASQLAVLACLLALWPVNGNPYALLVYPLVCALALFRPSIPRLRWLFYVAYPLHLAILLALKHAL